MPSRSTSWHLRPMQTGDIPHAETIRRLVGWNQTEADWHRLLALAPDGCFVAQSAGVPVGTVTTTRYASRLAWIGMLLVHPDQRRQGIGSALLQQAIQHMRRAGVECIGLDATPAGQPLYADAGFVPVWDLARWQGQIPAVQPGPVPGAMTEIPERMWPAIIELDRKSFGVPRPGLLRALAGQSSRVAVTTDSAGTLLGFGMVRAGSRAQMLGPLVAVTVESATTLFTTLCAGLPQHTLFWDIPGPNQSAMRLAESLGFTAQRTLVRMAWGGGYPAHDPTLPYALADLATG